MAWDEWEQLKTEAVSRQSAGMQLNQLPADGSGSSGGGLVGGQKDLASSPAEKRAAAQAIEQRIEPGTRKAGDWSDEETNSTVKAFSAKDGHGWVTSGALKSAHKTWGEQVQNLMNRLGSEKEALRNTSTLFQSTDLGAANRVGTSSNFNNY
ncbi:hypothetical protein [Streptomyces dysideae]|uniref:Uncharacterized protein n=1 Tax=Streptomyces dysideae TaxID=909626 RepID=A0A101UP71_9ACTN|nr:hypothetical protein [Streptomyces dysideae]KUO14309.1 hypothetical protein AQJ91_47570 [Streptomyces dysideae]